jgi:chromosome partitioning protein
MVIAVINNKGGTGKTTTSVSLAAALAGRGYQVLLADMDAQASASLSLGVQWHDLKPSVADVLLGDTEITGVIRMSHIPNLSLMTADMELVNTDLRLANVPGRENRLSECLEAIRHAYDFILLDCPPSLSLISVNALLAADRYIVAVTPEYLALEGLISLMDAVRKLEKGMGKSLNLLGIIFTITQPTLNITRKIIAIVREHYGEKVFQTEIKWDVRLSEAPSFSQSVFDLDPKSQGAKAYAMLTDELIRHLNMKPRP